MQFFDVYTKKTYEKDGDNKTASYKAGAMKITDRGSIFLRLFHIPDVEFFVYERESKLPSIDLDE
jgi:hypothetical protein